MDKRCWIPGSPIRLRTGFEGMTSVRPKPKRFQERPGSKDSLPIFCPMKNTFIKNVTS